MFVLVTRLEPAGIPLALGVGVGVHQLGRHGGVVADAGNAGQGLELAFVLRVLVRASHHTELHAFAHLDLHVGAGHGELGATAVDFISDADRLGVQIGIDRGDRMRKQNAAREWLDRVVDKACHGGALQHDVGLVAVAHHDFDLFAVVDKVAVRGTQVIRP